MKRVVLLVAVLSVAAASFAVVASTPEAGVVTLARRSVSWTGGPLSGSSAVACTPVSCDEFLLTIDVPGAHWKRSAGGVVIAIDWEDRNDEFDLHVFDPSGREVASSLELHTNEEQAFVFAPTPGVYRVQVAGFQVTNASYEGRAWIVRSTDEVARRSRATMRFAAPTFVDPQLWMAMPSVWAAREGTTYVAAPWSLTSQGIAVWRSLDGARTFRNVSPALAPGVPDPRMRPCPETLGGGDADIITDRTGRAYFLDLYIGGVTVGYSTDDGATWTCNGVAATSPEDDRPWLAPSPSADGVGPNVDAYLVYRDIAIGGLVPHAGELLKPISEHLDVTIDGGKTWKRRTVYARGAVGFTGPLFTAADGTLYHVYQNGTEVMVARSTDEGRTMRLVHVAERFGSPANMWMAGDVDAAGNVYVAWADQGTWDVMMSRSLDRGLTWSDPLRINPPASETAAMPWLAAGKAGDVAIAWYGTEVASAPEAAPAGARWYAWVARSVDAASARPSFARRRMSETPMRFGPLCVTGVGCGDRRVGDFFEIDIAPDGAIVASFADTGRIQETSDGLTPGPYVMVARQLDGLGMTRAAPLAAERVGDVDVDASPLDLSGFPRSTARRGAMRVSLPVSSVDLIRSLTTTGVATKAYWLVLWKANDRVEYAGLEIGLDGTATFFGGDQPVGQIRVDPLAPNFTIEKLATYPATFTLTGAIDAATNQILIDVPYDLYHLRPGDTLHSLQAFTMAGPTESLTSFQPLFVIDATPARSIRLGA